MSPPRDVFVPSKTFLSGEYAVLHDYPALIMTHQPFFTCRLSEASDLTAVQFHPESPAGLLELKLTGKNHHWQFRDPHKGAGGFGGSTAEFISVYKTLKAEGNVQDLKEIYFKIFEKEKTPPSGADLVSQFYEEPGCFVYTKTPFSLKKIDWPFDELEVLFFKTKVKLATHKHLESLGEYNFSKLGLLSAAVVEALVNKDQTAFLTTVKDFSLMQHKMGLLSAESQSTAESIGSFSGVLAVRGCGAMGADVLAAFVKKESLDYVCEQIELLNKGLKRIEQSVK